MTVLSVNIATSLKRVTMCEKAAASCVKVCLWKQCNNRKFYALIYSGFTRRTPCQRYAHRNKASALSLMQRL